jgi:hypothetical protein
VQVRANLSAALAELAADTAVKISGQSAPAGKRPSQWNPRLTRCDALIGISLPDISLFTLEAVIEDPTLRCVSATHVPFFIPMRFHANFNVVRLFFFQLSRRDLGLVKLKGFELTGGVILFLCVCQCGGACCE